MVSLEACTNGPKKKEGKSSSNSGLVMSPMGNNDLLATATGSVVSRSRQSAPRKADLAARTVLDFMRDRKKLD